MKTCLAPEKIAALLEKARTSGNTAELFGGERYFTEKGWTAGKLTPEMKGSFQGKQGTSVRSRKGRTYRKPNGSSPYIEQWWTEDRVLAYKV